MFLTPEALHVLVFDISSYKPELYDSLIGDWIDSIGDRAPGATIMVVGTHADLCWPEAIEKTKAHVLKCMHDEENSKIQVNLLKSQLLSTKFYGHGRWDAC